MKKQIFLLSMGLLFASFVLPDSSCCTTDTSCCNTSSSSSCCPSACDTGCTNDWGKTYMQVTPHFQSASPELTSCFNSNLLYALDRDDKHGAFQVVVFGGKNTKTNQAAAYFLPYGHTSLTFDGNVANTVQTFATVVAESVVQASATTAPTIGDQIGNGVAFIAAGTIDPSPQMFGDAAAYQFDGNKNTSKILPWNFGITYAALFEPMGANEEGSTAGSGLITNPTFKSTICPTWSYSHVGAGFALRYQFSDDKQGFFGVISTAVQNVRSKFCLNESDITNATAITSDNFATSGTSNITGITGTLALPSGGSGTVASVTVTRLGDTAITSGAAGFNLTAFNTTAVASADPVGSINLAYIGTNFPGAATTDTPTEATAAPANVTEAFQQEAWSYGKISNCNKITRLADIELSFGYQWFCGDCASTNWYLGIVIPTGNKPCATYIAPAVVGNGQHVGIMTGSCTQIMLSDSADYSSWYRVDMCWRYLFRNTQKRSFDLVGNSWSRYMMVWENEAAYTAAVDAANTITGTGASSLGAANRSYTPGINVFTTDFYIKPQFQGRINQAVYFQAEHFRAELGWNTFMRQKDCVQLACDWTTAPAFADSSYLGGVGLNNNRTIYNDSQTTAYNAIDMLSRVAGPLPTTPTALVTLAGNTLSADNYSDFAIGEELIDYDSVATSAAITNTPYLVFGYAFSGDYHPQFSVGGSYEFTTSNRALNQWLVWGKFEIAF